VTVGGRGEKHQEGNYYIACGGKWIPAGADALRAQRQQHALLSGNALEYELYSGRSVPKAAVAQPQEPVANGRKTELQMTDADREVMRGVHARTEGKGL